MAKPRSEKFVWVTWLARLMTGDILCEWAPWFKVQNEFERMPSSPELVKWKTTHNRMVRELRQSLKDEGKEVLFGNQIRFRLEVNDLILTGEPDLVAYSEKETGIYDCKTGSPRDSDQIQVMLYLYYLPRFKPEIFNVEEVKGYLIYRDQKVEIPASAIDQEFKENLQYFLGILERDEEPSKSPSPQECQFCDISKMDCPERMA